MGKRSDFTRRKSDKYLTPYECVPPLLPYLQDISTFIEPCAGDGRLVRHLERHGLRCISAFDTEPDSLMVRIGDALTETLPPCDAVISNFPWTRALMHPILDRMMRHVQTWSLHDANWMFTRQAVPYLKHCSHIVTVGRVKWIEGTTMASKDDVAWFRFDINHTEGPRFYNDR